jgi:hypothetical protein
MTVRHGGAGEDGILKRSKDGGCEYLDCELTVVEGEYARRKFWERFVLAGTTEGHAQAIEISHRTLKAILDSARGINPDDNSPEARAKRTVANADFDGMRFIARIGIEKGGAKTNGETYSDKNVLLAAITPGRKDWHVVEQTASPPRQSPSQADATSAAPAITKPTWAS